jgi:phosphatidylserine decarboxylase
MRIFTGETENVVVAPADGKIVVIEEVEENEYFHDRRKMVSVFMSVTNVHANWFPVEGIVKMVRHHNGNFAKAWLPKASVENERSTIVISTPSGHDVLVRQVAGAVARRIVTYAREEQTCKLDNHLGFIKFGSRVDVYLPLDAEIDVVMGQTTTGNTTVLGRLKPKQSQAEA